MADRWVRRTGDGQTSLNWSEIYERLARHPDRPGPAVRAEFERRVRAWATIRASGLDRDSAEMVTLETCAEVWRTLS